MRKQVFAWATDHWQLATDESFIYNAWEVIEVVDALAGATGELLTQYTWGLDLSGSLQGAGGIGGLLACEWPQTVGESKKYWFFYDANGNVGQLLRYRTTGGESVTPAARYEYDPYGNTLAAVDTDPQNDPGAAVANPFRFSTKWLDHEPATTNPAGAVGTTGLYYYGYRYYSPSLGRWISRDPIEEEGGTNLYAFCLNSSATLFDLVGLSCCGLDITSTLTKVISALDSSWNARRTQQQRANICSSMLSLRGWDIYELAWQKEKFVSPPWGSMSPCEETVTVNGKCYRPEEVNYYLWGWANRKCFQAGIKAPAWWRDSHPGFGPQFPNTPYEFTLPEAISLVKLYRGLGWGGTGIDGRVTWTTAGYYGGMSPSTSSVSGCAPCSVKYDDILTAYVGHHSLVDQLVVSTWSKKTQKRGHH